MSWFYRVIEAAANANSIAIFRYNATLFPTIQLSRNFIDFFVSQMSHIVSHPAQSISCLDDLIKPRHSFSWWFLKSARRKRSNL